MAALQIHWSGYITKELADASAPISDKAISKDQFEIDLPMDFSNFL